jgi:glycosyltransferase involved in cell wall biosynthesis
MPTGQSPPLRILFVNSGLVYGGAETQLIAILRRLKQIGHEPVLYLLTRAAPRRAELDEIGVPIVLDQKRSRFDLSVIRRLRHTVRDWQPHAVHSFLFDANVYSRIACAGLPVSVLNSERNHDYSLNLAQRAIHYPTRHLADAVIANSHAGERFARRMFGFRPTDTYTVWNGIDLKKVDARVSASRANYREVFFGRTDVRLAVVVGAIKAQKDPLLALQVAEHLIDSDPGWRVAFVGASLDGSMRAYRTSAGVESASLREQVVRRWQASRHRERIEFVGQRDDVIEIIADADALFSTSHHEGFPNVVLEAMAVRTPVVSTLVSDIEDILPSDLIVRTRDARAISASIIATQSRRGEIGAALRKWVETHATIKKSVDRLIEIYRARARLARGRDVS